MGSPEPHHCHATGCRVAVRPQLLMCIRHWRLVPPDLQRAVWRHYRPGQCDDKRPSPDWLSAARAAIDAVAALESPKPKAPPAPLQMELL